MFNVPNKYRYRNHPVRPSENSDGNNGFFIIPHYRVANYEYRIMASDGEGWEHISITVAEKGKPAKRNPTWQEMCDMKNAFWGEDDCCVQYHPAKSEYISMHPFCLHIWRPTSESLPIPLKEMVGVNPQNLKKDETTI